MRLGLWLSEAANGLRRNASMVVSVVLVTFISLTFVGAAILMQMQIGQMKNFWYDRAQVGIYMCTAISPGETCTAGEADQIDAVKAQLVSPTSLRSSPSTTSKRTIRRSRTSRSSSRATRWPTT
jgi:cell division transport system permease protein